MISINATLVIQLVNFLVLIWILNKILFKPIFKILDEREQVVQTAKAESERLKADATQKAKAIESRVEEARRKAAAERDLIRGQADSQANEITIKAQEQAAQHIASVRAETAKEADRARAGLSEFKDAIVQMLLMKVMGRKFG